MAKAEVLALRVIAERIENGEGEAMNIQVFRSTFCLSHWPSGKAKKVLAA